VVIKIPLPDSDTPAKLARLLSPASE
jgi:hypothetical protein